MPANSIATKGRTTHNSGFPLGRLPANAAVEGEAVFRVLVRGNRSKVKKRAPRLRRPGCRERARPSERSRPCGVHPWRGRAQAREKATGSAAPSVPVSRCSTSCGGAVHPDPARHSVPPRRRRPHPALRAPAGAPAGVHCLLYGRRVPGEVGARTRFIARMEHGSLSPAERRRKTTVPFGLCLMASLKIWSTRRKNWVFQSKGSGPEAPPECAVI